MDSDPVSSPADSGAGPYRRPVGRAVGRRYGPFRAITMSFYSADLYRDVASHWGLFSFFYLGLLLGLCWLLATIQIHSRFSTWIEEEAPKVVDQIPTLTFVQGELRVDVEQPYRIVDPETSQSLAVIDTTGQITSLDEDDAVVLLTRTQAFVRRNPQETRIYQFSELDGWVIDSNRVHGWLETIGNWFGFVFYPFALMFSFAYRTIQVLIYAVIGFFMSRILSVELSYSSLISLAIVAITAPLVLGTAFQLSEYRLPLSWLAWFFLAMVYLFFAVRANRIGNSIQCYRRPGC